MDSSTYVLTLLLKNSAGTTLSTATVDLPLETMVVGASYNNSTKEITLTLKNGNTLSFSIADLISGLQTEITSSNKLSSDLVDDTNKTNKFVTSTEKTTWNNKEESSNKVTTISSSSTSVQYPNVQAVYAYVNNIQTFEYLSNVLGNANDNYEGLGGTEVEIGNILTEILEGNNE